MGGSSSQNKSLHNTLSEFKREWKRNIKETYELSSHLRASIMGGSPLQKKSLHDRSSEVKSELYFKTLCSCMAPSARRKLCERLSSMRHVIGGGAKIDWRIRKLAIYVNRDVYISKETCERDL